MTRSELLQAAKEAGYPTPEPQLKTYRQEGLIQRPAQIWTSGQPGSDSVYPPGTLEQLIAVRQRHAGERRYDELRLDVWWDGYWIDADQLRITLGRFLDDAVADLRDLRREYPEEPFDAADALTVQARDEHRGEHPFFKLLLRRLGGNEEDLWSVVHTIFLVAFGGEPDWDPHDPDQEPSSLRRLTERALGFERAMHDRLFGAAPWLGQMPDVGADLRRLRDAGVFDVEHPGRRITEANDDQLEQARKDAVLFSDTLGVIAQAAEILHSHDIAALGTFVAARRGNQHLTRAGMVRGCLIFRELLPAENFDALAAVAPPAAVLAQGIVDFTSRYRGYRKYLKDAVAPRLAKMPPEARRLLQKTASNFVSSRPQLAALLNTD